MLAEPTDRRVHDRGSGVRWVERGDAAPEQFGELVLLSLGEPGYTIAATSTHTYLATRTPSQSVQLAGLVHGYTTATVWAAAILAAGAVTAAVLVNARLGTAPPVPAAAEAPVTDQPASAPTLATAATAA